MKTAHIAGLFAALFTTTLIAGLSPRRASAEGGFVVLVNKSNNTASLSRSELKRATTGGTKQWGNGAAVQLGVIPADAPETAQLATMLDLSTRELLSRIQEQVFKGEMRRPVVLRSSSDCLAFARSTAGAICVASAAAPVPPEARIVPIR